MFGSSSSSSSSGEDLYDSNVSSATKDSIACSNKSSSSSPSFSSPSSSTEPESSNRINQKDDSDNERDLSKYFYHGSIFKSPDSEDAAQSLSSDSE